MKSNILPFKSNSKSLQGIYYTLQWEYLEDGSMWYRFSNAKGEWDEWVKYNDN